MFFFLSKNDLSLRHITLGFYPLISLQGMQSQKIVKACETRKSQLEAVGNTESESEQCYHFSETLAIATVH